MFEKEAEEYVCKRNPLVTKEWFIDAFKKYNKGEKVKYLKDCEIAEYEAYITGAEFGYNKANEWHYVKDGDLPKNNTQTLVLLENKRMKISIFMENKFTVWNKEYNTYAKLYNVIAWKEIVLPELPKESE